MILLVHPKDVREEWPAVARYIEAAMAQSLVESADDLRRMCMEDRAQLWIDDQGRAAAISIVVQGKNRVLQIVALGGKRMEQWLDEMTSAWSNFARAHGCAAVLATGRPGWEQSFKRAGARITKITGVMEVNHA